MGSSIHYIEYRDEIMHRQIPLVHATSLGDTNPRTNEKSDKEELIGHVRMLVRTASLSMRLTKDAVVRSVPLSEPARQICKVESNNRSSPLCGRCATWYTSAEARGYLEQLRKGLRTRNTTLAHPNGLLGTVK